MSPDQINFLKDTYPRFWHEVLLQVPAGHWNLVASLFHQCYLIAADQGDTSPWVTLHFERLDDGLFRAYAAPLVDFEKWTDGNSLAVIIALQFFNERQKIICEVCGLPGGRYCISPEFCSRKKEKWHGD
ncbi:hypothetical protein [Agrobacterium sp. B1(2019)]|uniref:hypothetical protein n=1 Tax=Agrobacterium sp. B1(2019) TaxID=2607032 RepID=UPI0011EE2399|nr:hypothetical protein [Agrobacterium sp. B1(2019)]TZG36642.1 hypothetical protein AGR1_03850 [Agrobacterium sp. B1(2019)]